MLRACCEWQSLYLALPAIQGISEEPFWAQVLRALEPELRKKFAGNWQQVQSQVGSWRLNLPSLPETHGAPTTLSQSFFEEVSNWNKAWCRRFCAVHKDIFAQGGWAVEKEAIMPMVRSQLQEWNREELRKRAREIQDLSRPRILNNQSNLQNYNELIQHLLSGAMNGKISPSQAQETEALISMTLELNPILERGFMMKLHEIMAPNKPAKLLSLVGDDSELDNESRGNTQANDECQVLRITPPIEDRHKPMVPTTPTQSFDSQSADQQERQEISESPAWRIGLRVADRQFSIDLSGSPARIIDQEMTDRHSAVDMGLETTGDDDNRTADVHDPVWDMDEPIMQSIEQDTPEPGKTLLQSLERYERAFRRCKLRNSPTGNAEKAVEETGKTEMKEKTFMRRSESGSLFGEESESKRTTNCREEKKGAVKVELLKPELTGEVTVEVMDGERESTKNKKKRRRGTSEAALAEADMEIREQEIGRAHV